MKHYKDITVPARTSKKLDYITCDFCGELDRDRELTAYDFKEVTIRYVYGTRYPEGGSQIMESVDMCPKCYLEKLRPWIIDHGVEIQQDEQDW